jgi:hypothetical protein
MSFSIIQQSTSFKKTVGLDNNQIDTKDVLTKA